MAMCYVQMYFSYLEPLADLTDEEVGRVVRAILKYGADRTIPDLSPSEKMAFSFMKTNFDRDAAAYDAKVEKKRENGKKGGAPMGNQNAKKQKQPKQPKEEEKEEEETNKKEESSSSKEEVVLTTTMTTLVESYEEAYGTATPVIQRMLGGYVESLGPELVNKVIQVTAEAGGKTWPYLAKSLEDCKRKGMDLAAYEAEQIRRKGGSNMRVDRPAPSGNDILARPRRPLRTHREE